MWCWLWSKLERRRSWKRKRLEVENEHHCTDTVLSRCAGSTSSHTPVNITSSQIQGQTTTNFHEVKYLLDVYFNRFAIITRPENPRWRTAAILEKSINRDISVTAWPILTKFRMMTHIGPLDPIGRQNFECVKNQDGGRPLSEVAYTSVTDNRRTTGIVSCESERRGLQQTWYSTKEEVTCI